jgi:protein-tyrosine-phosphatase
MAEAFFRAEVARRGADVEVGSAGLAVGSMRARMGAASIPAPRGTVQVMAEAGFDLQGHRAVQASEELLAGCDLVLVMERAHVREVALRAPEALDRVFVLKHLVELGERRPLTATDLRGRVDELRARRGDPRIAARLGPEVDLADPIGAPYPMFLAARDEIGQYMRRAAEILLGEAP